MKNSGWKGRTETEKESIEMLTRDKLKAGKSFSLLNRFNHRTPKRNLKSLLGAMVDWAPYTVEDDMALVVSKDKRMRRENECMRRFIYCVDWN